MNKEKLFAFISKRKLDIILIGSLLVVSLLFFLIGTISLFIRHPRFVHSNFTFMPSFATPLRSAIRQKPKTSPCKAFSEA